VAVATLPLREPGERPPAAVRVGVPPGVRGGAPPGRREARRAGGRPLDCCCALVMTLCIACPRSVGPEIPGGNLVMGILYGVMGDGGKHGGARVGVPGFFTYQGDGAVV